ncbi:MAG: N-6 DNA methylase [Dermatophilaceae bacterium]
MPLVSSHLVETAAQRKARGAFYTPTAVARYVTDWAIRSVDDRVLEPSCGEAAFLVEAARRLRDLGACGDLAGRLHGTELHEASAEGARAALEAVGEAAIIKDGDFFQAEPTPAYAAVIGNPPYVRYQAFTGASRAVAQQAALRAGVSLTRLASSWAAFTVHAALHVRPGGRLGLVLPAEMLSVNYAAPIRDFLMASFGRVRLVLFTERVFPGVIQDVVLLLAEGRGEGPSDHCELVQARNADALAELDTGDVRRWRPPAGGRWSHALVDPAAAEAYACVVPAPGERASVIGGSDDSRLDAEAGDADAGGAAPFVPLVSWGATTSGMVTGANAFFALSGAQARHRRIPSAEFVRISPPGSRHLRVSTLTSRRLDELDAVGEHTWLFRPPGEPSHASRAYLREGVARGVDQAYKCRVRTPWWRVPLLAPADLFLTYMNADTARLCTNLAGAHHLNSVHGVYLAAQHRQLGRELLPLASLNSVTLLGAELVGRAYGGGVLKLEPREADRWPMPAPAMVARRAAGLRAIRPAVRHLIAAGRLWDASEAVDTALLDGVLPRESLMAVRAGRVGLHARRTARSRSR